MHAICFHPRYLLPPKTKTLEKKTGGCVKPEKCSETLHSRETSGKEMRTIISRSLEFLASDRFEIYLNY